MKYLFAGPCSAESAEQILQTARFFKKWQNEQNVPLSAIRAGAWKPRTRPGCFEGHGEKALVWMQEAQTECGIPFITEVAGTQHIDLCLKHNITHFWIGARTTSNPFLMEEIGQALKGCDCPVWIKNPISPDLALWLGGIERISRYSKGLVGGIHRGFGLYDSKPYRNAPMWETIVEFRHKMPDMPLLCDPSHISGSRDYVQEISQAAIEMEMDGFMLEVHPCPAEALSDASQQLNFENFEMWYDTLMFRDLTCNSAQMEQIRHLLDDIDDELIQVLARRMELVRQLGKLKKEENLSVLQLDRWNRVIDRCMLLAQERGLDKNFVQKLLHCVHAEAVRIQKND